MAWMAGNSGRDSTPFLAAWEYGKGRTMTTGGAMGNWLRAGTWPATNDYGPDILVNMILYSTRRPLIENVEVFHALKIHFRIFRTRKLHLIHLGDFVDKLGANTVRIQEEVSSLDNIMELAVDRYLEQDFGGANDVMLEAFDKLIEAEAMAKNVKERAMLWIYLIEWAAVTGTLTLAGSFTYMAMLRRRFYRQVKITRFGQD